MPQCTPSTTIKNFEVIKKKSWSKTKEKHTSDEYINIKKLKFKETISNVTENVDLC
jgi:hypothetical protein